jgi:Fe-Mn family superoxide dismutase
MVTELQKLADIHLIAKLLEPKEYPLEGQLKSMKDKSLTEHRDVLYKGYIDNYNKIVELIRKNKSTDTNPHYSEIGELRRRLTWAHNGSFLHQLYFENIGGSSKVPEYRTAKLINDDFKTVNRFKKDLLAAGAVPPVGWVVWAWSALDSKTHIFIIDEHHNHCPIGVVPLLVLDAWEHAHYLDYKSDRKKFLDKTWKDINWEAVEDRVELLNRFMKMK